MSCLFLIAGIQYGKGASEMSIARLLQYGSAKQGVVNGEEYELVGPLDGTGVGGSPGLGTLSTRLELEM